jgi:FkbM family methyltransferase
VQLSTPTRRRGFRTILASEDIEDYLRFLRTELAVSEDTVTQYAGELSVFLAWSSDGGLGLDASALALPAFAEHLRSTPIPGPKGARQRSPELIRQSLAAARGLLLHLTARGSLSTKALAGLHDVFDLRDAGVTSYAQSGEDLQIASYVGHDRIRYIDVGCLWPKTHSNTFYFYERGGSGLCIDPNPHTAAEFRAQRPRDLVLECAITADSGTLTYYMHNNPVFNTLSLEHADELRRRAAAMPPSPQRHGRERSGTVEVQCMSLEQAIRTSGLLERCDGEVDVLSIDTEGLEPDVLAGFGFDTLRPRLVVVEDVARGVARHQAVGERPVAQTLIGHGYRLAGHVGFNLFFVDDS